MAVTNPSTLPAAVQQSLNATLLSVPTADYIHKMPAVKEDMPRNGGRFKRFRRYNPLNSFLVPLGDTGVTPPSQTQTAIDIDAEVNWYGTWTEISEQTVLQNQEGVLQQEALRLAQAFRTTEDQLISNMLASTASSVQATNGTLSGDIPTEINGTDIDIVTTALLNANGDMFLSGIEGANKFGTSPVRRAYIGLCSTELTSDLNNLPKFKGIEEYPFPDRVMDGEWGNYRNVRFFVSSLGSKEANASDLGNTVYNVFIVAKESYACIDQQGGEARFIYHPARYSGPLELTVTCASKFAQAYALLNDQWVSNLQVTKLA